MASKLGNGKVRKDQTDHYGRLKTGGGGSSNYKKKMLYSEGVGIYEEPEMTNALTYIQVKEILDNANNDVALWNGNYILLPEYSNSTEGEEAIWFNATTVLDGKTYLYRIIINSDNEVQNNEYQLINTNDKADYDKLGLIQVDKISAFTLNNGYLNQYYNGTYILSSTNPDVDVQYMTVSASGNMCFVVGYFILKNDVSSGTYLFRPYQPYYGTYIPLKLLQFTILKSDFTFATVQCNRDDTVGWIEAGGGISNTLTAGTYYINIAFPYDTSKRGK